MGSIRVLVVDDHPLMREALVAAIGAEADMEVAGEAADGLEAVEQARVLQPDVIVMDLLMPGLSGLEAIATIRSEFPEALILALTSSIEEGKVLAAVEAGAQGYLLKDARRAELLEAIREVSQGNAYLSPEVALTLVRNVRTSRTAASMARGGPAGGRPIDVLTDREREVLSLVGAGLANAEIARALHISEATVRSHIYHLLGKLGLESRSQAVGYAVRHGMTGENGETQV